MKYYPLCLFIVIIIFISCFVYLIQYVEDKYQAEKQNLQKSSIEYIDTKQQT